MTIKPPPPEGFATTVAVLVVGGGAAGLCAALAAHEAGAEVVMKPLTTAELHGEEAAKMQKLLDVLEDLDDVQEVFTNAVMG